jgi:beta-galactosidase
MVMWRATFRLIGAVIVVLLSSHAQAAGDPTTASIVGDEPRAVQPLMHNWKFIFDDVLTDKGALASTGADWEPVSLPHTWNAKDAAGTHITAPYRRGVGWYRLEFDTPSSGARHWLEFGAASIVADVWLNGKKLGQHRGAFTIFRLDVTDALVSHGRNVLLVKVDNRAPATSTDPTAIIPLAGDFNISGGLYRYVALVSTLDPAHIDLGDLSGPGVYATTTSIAGGNATVMVRIKLKSDAARDGHYVVRTSLLDADGHVAQRAEKAVLLKAGGTAETEEELDVGGAHLWQGIEDPYQYKLTVELSTDGGDVVDKVAQNFGIRQIHFDVQEGFFLNGKHVALHGVAMHQDFLGKGWAVSHHDIDESLRLVKETGANTVRLAHYPYSQYTLDRIDEMGLVGWAELPFGLGVTVEPPIELGGKLPCPTRKATPAFLANADEQLREMIRQEYNHVAIAMWAIGNETTFFSKDCQPPMYDNITPVLRELQGVAKDEDLSRPTTVADNLSKVEPPLQGGYIPVGGITDIWAINQYYLWYSGGVSGLGAQLDALHARYPNQPIGVSEYGAGAALTQHTDNPRGGPVESVNTGEAVVYQTEEYAGYVHEQNYAMLLSRPYVWGTYVWNMFDFGSGLRNEGDLRGVNTKGLVTFDRKTKKDPFYFYKANWSRDPVTYITGRRYTNRAYAVTDVKVYSNADSVELSLNGTPVGSMTKDQCLLKTCVFKGLSLSLGDNKIVAVGHYGDTTVSDSVDWSLRTSDVNIAAGQLETGFTSSSGARFGSDTFFIGGVGDWLVEKGTRGVTDPTPVKIARYLWPSVHRTGTNRANTSENSASPTPNGDGSSPDIAKQSGNPAIGRPIGPDADAQLFSNFRRGQFSYHIPLADGDYEVTLGFLEPTRTTAVGNRIFDVIVDGVTKLRDFDVLKETGGTYRTAITRTFNTTVSRGHLDLDFMPKRGEAVVSNITIRMTGQENGMSERQ